MVGGKNRYLSRIKAIRKLKIDRAVNNYMSEDRLGWYTNLHQYSKNKIHCSCPLCSVKTRNKGNRRRNNKYYPAINYKISDIRRLQRLDYPD